MSAEVWPIGEGVVEFPNGVRVRGRALRDRQPSGLEPTLGVYLLAEPPPSLPWPTEWIRWPDFRLPSDPDAAVRILTDVFAAAASERVDVACVGGRGRTGTALAVLAVQSGIDPADAVEWVRDHYTKKAVETPWQRRWVNNLVL